MDTQRVLQAISDETRFSMLNLLLKHDYCVRSLAQELELTEATISQHLKQMREANLVEGERRGHFIHYQVNRPLLKKLATEIEALAQIETQDCSEHHKENCHNHNDTPCEKKGKCSPLVIEHCHGENS